MFPRDDLNYEPIPLPDRVSLDDAAMAEAARDFLGDMRKRHTVRVFSDKPVPCAVIEDCIRAAGTAPRGANHQPWLFAAISAPDLKARIRAAEEATVPAVAKRKKPLSEILTVRE